MAEQMLHAGYAARDITPSPGVEMTGFIAREGPCTGTFDPLRARALVFQAPDGSRAALVTCDLIGLGRHLVARVRQAIHHATGIAPEAILFNCSHTHSGPETGVLTTIGVPDPAYLVSLERGLAGVVLDAAQMATPVRLTVASADVPDGLAINRVYRRIGQPEAIDRQLTVVRVDRAGDEAKASGGDSGVPLATIVAFACHAVSLGHSEREASADFVAPLRRSLEAAGTGPVLYVNGCGGDINPASMDRRGRDACAALGNGLAGVALGVFRSLAGSGSLSTGAVSTGASNASSRTEDTAVATAVRAASAMVALPFLPLRTPDEVAALLASGREKLGQLTPGTPSYRGTLITEVEYPLRLLRLHYGSERVPACEAEVQALQIGPIAIVALPGEIFSSLGRRIKGDSPLGASFTLVAGWSNDNVGYIPDRDAYPLGGYEADVASRYYGYPAGWAPEAGDALVDAAGALLSTVAGAR